MTINQTIEKKHGKEALSEPVIFRHTASVKNFVDQLAIAESLGDATLNRKIYNAGILALYGKKIESNVIVN